MNKRTKKLSKEDKKELYQLSKELFQGAYICIFIFISIGICGNIETDTPISKLHWIIFGITGFLSVGKFIYCLLHYDLKDDRG